MLKFIETTGRTEEAAIEAALEKLGLDRDDVSVEILERPKSGFLGIGSTPARVKVTYEGPDDEPEVIPEPPKPAPAPQSPGDQSGIWLDALSSVLKPVPVMNAGWIQVARRMVPVQDGKIEGAKPDRVVYFLAPDDSMRAMRIEKGDLVLVVPQTLPVDGAIMLVEYGAHRCLRRVKLLGNANILLQSGDRDLDAEAMNVSEIKFVGRAVRVEIAL